MADAPPWVRGALLGATVLLLVLLFVEYVLGLWTNVDGVGLDSGGMFTSSSSGSTLSAHLAVGYLLGLVALLAVIFAALTREVRFIAQAVFALIWIGVAGVAGRAFIDSSPNAPIDSFAMGVAFLLAFGTATGLMYSVLRRPPAAPSVMPPVAVQV